MQVQRNKKKTLVVFILAIALLLVGVYFYLYKNNPGSRQYDLFKSINYPAYMSVHYDKTVAVIDLCFDSCESHTSVNLSFNESNETAIADLTKEFEKNGLVLKKEDRYCFPSSPGEECMYQFDLTKSVPKCSHIFAVYETFNQGSILLHCS